MKNSKEYLFGVFLYLIFIGLVLTCSPVHASECITDKVIIKELEVNFQAKIIKVWKKEGSYSEYSRTDLIRLARKLSKQVVKDNFTCNL